MLSKFVKNLFLSYIFSITEPQVSTVVLKVVIIYYKALVRCL